MLQTMYVSVVNDLLHVFFFTFALPIYSEYASVQCHCGSYFFQNYNYNTALTCIWFKRDVNHYWFSEGERERRRDGKCVPQIFDGIFIVGSRVDVLLMRCFALVVMLKTFAVAEVCRSLSLEKFAQLLVHRHRRSNVIAPLVVQLCGWLKIAKIFEIWLKFATQTPTSALLHGPLLLTSFSLTLI